MHFVLSVNCQLTHKHYKCRTHNDPSQVEEKLLHSKEGLVVLGAYEPENLEGSYLFSEQIEALL